MITIINYGLGNVQAFANLYKRLNIPAAIATSAPDLDGASKLILPGVGSFDHAMELLDGSGMREALEEKVLRQAVPVARCLRRQCRFSPAPARRAGCPGWAGSTGVCGASMKRRCGSRPVCPIWGGMTWCRRATPGCSAGSNRTPASTSCNSYYFDCASNDNVLATSEYGIAFGCAVRSNNIYGVQFHPEKSHDFGTRLLKNFAEL